jgi:soluble lytic murein transglycosylase-like protein
MQLMPGTAQDLKVVNSFDPQDNIRGGVRYLRFLLDTFKGDVTLALAAYNAGLSKVARYGGIPPYEETRNYVSRVLALQKNYQTN